MATHGGNNSSMLENTLDALGLCVQILTSFFIGRYDPSHTTTSSPYLAWLERPMTPRFCESLLSTGLIHSFNDPSPTTFVFAMMTFTIATLWLYANHQEEKHQGRFLMLGVVAALLASGVQPLVGKDMTWVQSIQMHLPPSIIIAMLGSTITSRIFDLRRHQRRDHSSEEGQGSVEQETKRQERDVKTEEGFKK